MVLSEVCNKYIVCVYKMNNIYILNEINEFEKQKIFPF